MTTSSRQSWESSAQQITTGRTSPSRPICGFTLHGGCREHIVGAPYLIISTCISWDLPVSPGIPPYPAISRRGYRGKTVHTRDQGAVVHCFQMIVAHEQALTLCRPRHPHPSLCSARSAHLLHTDMSECESLSSRWGEPAWPDEPEKVRASS